VIVRFVVRANVAVSRAAADAPDPFGVRSGVAAPAGGVPRPVPVPAGGKAGPVPGEALAATAVGRL
jgi:hypothetical protein